MPKYDAIFEEIYDTDFQTFEKHFIMSMIIAFLKNQEHDEWKKSWRDAQVDTAKFYRKMNHKLKEDYDKTVNSSITRGMTGIEKEGPFNNSNGMLGKIENFFAGEEDEISQPIINNLGLNQSKKIIEKIRLYAKNAMHNSGPPKATEDIDVITKLLGLRKNVILEGVPGTGKTWIRDKVKIAMKAEMEVVTFHPASTYEEFVGGIFPTSSNDGNSTLLFEYQKGTLSRFANRAMDDEERDYILFIDEINRANIPLVMGELLTIIESTKRTVPGAGKVALSEGQNLGDENPWEVAVHVESDDSKSKYLRLPSNLYILATMNTSDRSVVSMDAALRRRFAYYRIETKLTDNGRDEMWGALNKSWWSDKQDSFDSVFGILAKINKHLQSNIGPDAMLGHSYLFFSDDETVGLDGNQVVSEMMELNILPQIADTLTSMNKTDQSFVDSTNKILREMPDSMLRHELKAPTSGGKSLDIAVTVCERNDTSKTIVDHPSQYSDDETFVLNNDDAGPEIEGISGYMVVRDSKFIVLKDSGSISPQVGINKNKNEGNKEEQVAKLERIADERNLLISAGIIKEEEGSDHGIFQKEHSFDNINQASQMVRGTTVTGAKSWKRKTDGAPYGEIHNN